MTVSDDLGGLEQPDALDNLALEADDDSAFWADGDSADNELVRRAWVLFGRAGGPRGRQRLLEAAETRMMRLGLTKAGLLSRLRLESSEWGEIWRLYDEREGADSFFRFPAQFEVLSALVCERATLASERVLRVLSAGSRRGHEAFSLAMTLALTGLIGKGWKIAIEGFDPSSWQVKAAKEGLFTGDDLAFLDPAAAKRWFAPRSGCWRYKTGFGPSVDFFQANPADLQTGPLAALEGAYDVIFCRGLSFDCPDHLIGRLAKSVSSLLAPEGLLLTAPGEFWPLPPDLRLEERDGVVYWRRLPVKTKSNTFFLPKPSRGAAKGRLSAKSDSPGQSVPDEALAGRFEELLASDPGEAREVVLEILSRDMDRGLVSLKSLDLMRRIEESLGRGGAAERLRLFLKAWAGEPE